MKLHLFAHNKTNLVKKGDKVKAYDQYIGEIGNANGIYYAHLHYSISEGLTQSQIKSYVNGWSVGKVKKYYFEPKVDRSKMFKKPVDNGERGYGWLQTIANGSPHPGIDYNGLGGGNTDYGYKFKSPVDGEVVYSGDWGKGWGKVIIVEEIINKEEPMSNENVDKLMEFIKKNIEDYGSRLNSNERKRIEEKIKNLLKGDNNEAFVNRINEYDEELARINKKLQERNIECTQLANRLAEKTSDFKKTKIINTELTAENDKLKSLQDSNYEALGLIARLQEALKLIMAFKPKK